MNVSRRGFVRAAGASVVGIGLCGCHATPVTNRRRVMLVPEGQEIALGAQAFEETLSSEPLSDNSHLIQIVNRVGQRIAQVSGRSDYEWDFRLIASPTQNAFCLPGGKVAVYEGILPVCENEAGLAVVMSHEVAHALARHGGERMSQNILMDGAQNVAHRFATNKFPSRQEQLMRYYGVGSKLLVELPYSRLQESEADHIGVKLMAYAGYDPRVAPKFWNRFGQAKVNDQQVGTIDHYVSGWFSTHPSDEKRASDLMNLMDEAMLLYNRTKDKIGVGEPLLA